MLKKTIIIIFLATFLYSCEYSPLYSSKNLKKINLNISKITGDKELNKYIMSDLNKYFNSEGKEVKLSIITNYSKDIASRDTKGSISNYKLLANATFNIEVKGKRDSVSFKEDFIMKNLEDNFEKNNYEKTIKKNFSNSITDKLMIQIFSIK